MNIVNYQEINKKVFELLIKHAEQDQIMTSLYNKIEPLLYDLFKRDEMKNLPPSTGQENCQQIERSGINSLNNGISLRPYFNWNQTSQKIPILDNISNEHPLISKYNSFMRELYGLQNTKIYYIDFIKIYSRMNCVQGYDSNFIQKWYNFGVINAIHTTTKFSEIFKLP